MAHPKIINHPNQESKSGIPPYASPATKNYSANEPLSEGEDENVASGVESQYRDAALNRKSKKGSVTARILKKIKK